MGSTGPMRAVLRGTGIGVPEREVDNHQLARIFDTSDEWIRERSGIVSRRYVEAGVASSDLAVVAARQALVDAKMEPGEIDYVVCATMTPDHFFPGVGTVLQHKLGMPPVAALDIRQQCAGYVYGLPLVDALIRSGAARKVLLVGTDVHTDLMPYSKEAWRLLLEGEGSITDSERAFIAGFRNIVVLFGDAAGAMVFCAEPAGEGPNERGILGAKVYGDGAHKDILYVPGGGSLHRPWVDAAMVERGDTVPVMEGRQVFKLAVTLMPEVTRALLAHHGFGIDDVDLVVMHQANLRINEAAQKALGLPNEKVHNNIQKYGNTTSATLPLCFHEAREAGKAPEGALVAFTALGAGLHWGSVLLRV